MNNIRNIDERNNVVNTDKNIRRAKKSVNAKMDYLTDEALEKLIADVEKEPMLRPPMNFGDDVISRIQRKRKYKKNMQLFSYSMRVIAATAAALAIVLIVPDNISTEESRLSGWQPPKYSRQEVRVQEDEVRDDGTQQGNAQEDNKYVMAVRKPYDERFIYKLNKHMDEYVSMINGKLNQFVRMEVNFNEEEEK